MYSYLLGSGGTLLFDLTIMLQSWMYGSAPPAPPIYPSIERTMSSNRRSLFRRRTRYIEDGFGSVPPIHTNLHNQVHPHGERQPLLAAEAISDSPVAVRAAHAEGVIGVRGRSVSPEAAKRGRPPLQRPAA